MIQVTPPELFAQLYDVYVQDWPGEFDFYRGLQAGPLVQAHGLLEVACGTGRIAVRLARAGARVTGLDISPELLVRAHEKSAGLANLRLVCADMRAFELGEQFGAAIIPGHSFQFMITPDMQSECLAQIKRHLVPGGLLVIHVNNDDHRWLAELLELREPEYKRAEPLTHPSTAQKYRKANYWTFESATQTATNHMRWEQIDENGLVVQTWSMEPMQLHVAFRFEMEHLLIRAGFTVEALYGDFFKNAYGNESESMIWMARKPGS